MDRFPKLNAMLERYHRIYSGALADTAGGLADMASAPINALYAGEAAKRGIPYVRSGHIPTGVMQHTVPEPKDTSGKVARFVSSLFVPLPPVIKANPLLEAAMKTQRASRAAQAVIKSGEMTEDIDKTRRMLMLGAVAAPVAAKLAPHAEEAINAVRPQVAAGLESLASKHVASETLHEHAAKMWAKVNDEMTTRRTAILVDKSQPVTAMRDVRPDPALLEQAQAATRDAHALTEEVGVPEGYMTLGAHDEALTNATHPTHIDPTTVLSDHIMAAADHRKALGPYANSPLHGADIEAALGQWRLDPRDFPSYVQETLDDFGFRMPLKSEKDLVAAMEKVEEASPGYVSDWMGSSHPHPLWNGQPFGDGDMFSFPHKFDGPKR